MADLKLTHSFADPALLEQALRHRSAGTPHNERLEFLGDGILGCVIAMELFARFPQADEGSLTRARAELVRESALAEVATGLSLGQFLTMGSGEMKAGGHRRASILADAMEAVIGAVYLDSDFATARAFILHYWEPLLSVLPPPRKIQKDAKTRLQELLQGRGFNLPHYEMERESGEDHARVFHVVCRIPSFDIETRGDGTSRRGAEQVAADMALTRLLERL